MSCYFRKLKSGKRKRICRGLGDIDGGPGSGRKPGKKGKKVASKAAKTSKKCRKVRVKGHYVCVCKGKKGGMAKLSRCGMKKKSKKS